MVHGGDYVMYGVCFYRFVDVILVEVCELLIIWMYSTFIAFSLKAPPLPRFLIKSDTSFHS